MVLSISEILNGRDDYHEYHIKSLDGEICLRPLTSGEWDKIDEIKQKDLGDYTINEKTITKKKRRVKGEMESKAKFNINASSKATKKAMYEAIKLSTDNPGNPEKWTMDHIKKLRKNEVAEIYEKIEEISGANDVFTECFLLNYSKHEKVIEATKDIITEARICHEEVVWERRKHDDEKTAVANIWRLVKMTNRQLEFKRYFKNNIDYLLTLDLDDEEQFEEVYEELKKPISTLRRYSKFGMTFSIDPKTDALIDEVLVKSGREKLRNKINKISNKKYFVE